MTAKGRVLSAVFRPRDRLLSERDRSSGSDLVGRCLHDQVSIITASYRDEIPVLETANRVPRWLRSYLPTPQDLQNYSISREVNLFILSVLPDRLPYCSDITLDSNVNPDHAFGFSSRIRILEQQDRVNCWCSQLYFGI